MMMVQKIPMAVTKAQIQLLRRPKILKKHKRKKEEKQLAVYLVVVKHLPRNPARNQKKRKTSI